MLDTPGDVRTNSYAMCSPGPLHTDKQVLDDQLCTDTGYSLADLPKTMDDKDEGRGRVREIRARGMT